MAKKVTLPPEEDARLKALGRRLKRWRKHRSLTRAQVAVKASISVDHVGALERGENVPTKGTLDRLCEVLGAPLPRKVVGS